MTVYRKFWGGSHAPLNTPQSTTVLSSIRLTGEKVFTTYTGGTAGERFVAHLKETLIPTLQAGDIVVMDNMRSHHVKAVGELLRQNGIIPLYLLPYSPDFNPIEMMWSKMRAILRKWKIRNKNLLFSAIDRALALVFRTDAFHWFSFSGYLLIILMNAINPDFLTFALFG